MQIVAQFVQKHSKLFIALIVIEVFGRQVRKEIVVEGITNRRIGQRSASYRKTVFNLPQDESDNTHREQEQNKIRRDKYDQEKNRRISLHYEQNGIQYFNKDRLSSENKKALNNSEGVPEICGKSVTVNYFFLRINTVLIRATNSCGLNGFLT